MHPEEVRELVRRYVEEPWNKGNVDIIDDLCAPEYKLHYGTDVVVGGREELKEAARQGRAASPDFAATVRQIIVEDDRVAYEWTMCRTEDGRLVTTVGMSILHLRDGQIVDDCYFITDELKGC